MMHRPMAPTECVGSAGPDGFRDIPLGLYDSCFDKIAACQKGSNGRRECTAGAVVVACFDAFTLDQLQAVVWPQTEDIHTGICIQVPAF